jgi:hypothetical protein
MTADTRRIRGGCLCGGVRYELSAPFRRQFLSLLTLPTALRSRRARAGTGPDIGVHDGPEVSIRLGTLDDDPGIRPGYHSFVDDLPAWDTLAEDGLPRYPSRPPREVT